MNAKNISLWICQLAAAGILLWAGLHKFVGASEAVALFTRLGMEPFGRFLIGTIECAGGLLLLTESFSAIGAMIAASVATGALIAHSTHLGFGVAHDGGRQLVLLALLGVTSGIVLYARRKNIPIIGETL